MTNTENKTGLDCVGTEWTTNRVLTLSNTNLTVFGGFQVFLDGQLLIYSIEYSVSNLTANSTITFLIPVGNSSNIVANYNTIISRPSGSFVYTSEANVYLRSGLTSSELDLSTYPNIILDAEAELELVTGRKFTNANTKIEYLSGYKKDIMENKASTTMLSEYPVQTITSLLILNTDGTTNKTYATWAGSTFETADYWLESMVDPINNSVIANGKVRLKTDTFPVGNRNIKVVYTHGYTLVPQLVQNLATCLAAIRMWIAFMGSQYNRLDSYAIPQQSANKGDFYVRGKTMINQLTEEANKLLDRIGRRSRRLYFSTGADR